MPRGRPRGSGGGSVIKPRGRMSAYAFFVQTCREEHKKQHPEETVKFAEFSQQCAERWKTMSDKEKQRFHDLSGKDKERYDTEMQDYVPPPGSGRRARRARGMKKIKDPNKPKRALSAFFYYANEERPKVRSLNPDFSVGEVAKELGRQWNELTETEKAPYEKQAEEDRARYDREMQVYRTGELPAKRMKSNGHAEGLDDLDDDEEEEEDDYQDDDE